MQYQSGFTLLTPAEFGGWLRNQTVNRTVSRVQLHHTWKPNYRDFNGSNHFTLQANMKRYHVEERGWSDIAQHFTIFPDGMICTGRPLDENPAGITGANTGAICIENLGDFDDGKDLMRPAQRDGIVQAVALLCRRFGLPVNGETVIYHHWFAEKTCPGTAFFGGNARTDATVHLYPLVQGALGTGPRPAPASTHAIADASATLKDKLESFFTKLAFWKKHGDAYSDQASLGDKLLIVLCLGLAGFFTIKIFSR